MKKYKVGYTTGVFDMFHVGHLNIIEKAKEQCEYLIVGVSPDEVVQEYKHKTPVIAFEQRKKIVEAIRYVDLVIPEENWEQKINDVKKYEIDVVVMGDDWAGSTKFDYLKEYCDVVYLPRTKGISTTQIKKELGLQPAVNGVNQIPVTEGESNKK